MHWKIVAFDTIEEENRFEALPKEPVQVALFDANGEVVASAHVVTNEFASASGTFVIPNGRMLGAWSLQTELTNGTGYSAVRVEEYKRPTFEVTLNEPEGEVQLNRTVELTGNARYFFGAPVNAGTVEWYVERVPKFRYYGYRYRRGIYPARGQSQILKRAESTLRPDGTFELSFLAEADPPSGALERQATRYDYKVHANVTDPGGETRFAERSISLGFVAVELQIEADRIVSIATPVISVKRLSLGGAALSGSSRYRVERLAGPRVPRLPAEMPAELDETKTLVTPGDRLRSRTETAYDPVNRLGAWKARDQIAAGEFEHDEQGVAKLEFTLPHPRRSLEPHAYRITVTTSDTSGETTEATHDFLVLTESERRRARRRTKASNSLPLPFVSLTNADRLEVGETLEVFVDSGYSNQHIELALVKDREVLERRTLRAGSSPRLQSFEIKPEHRGGVAVRAYTVRDHQLLSSMHNIAVPFTDRELDLTFETFRDELRPGAKETWTVHVAPKDQSELDPTAVELLASMYDRSLDLFAPHEPTALEKIWRSQTSAAAARLNAGLRPTGWWSAFAQLHACRDLPAGPTRVPQ